MRGRPLLVELTLRAAFAVVSAKVTRTRCSLSNAAVGRSTESSPVVLCCSGTRRSRHPIVRRRSCILYGDAGENRLSHG